MEEQSQLSRFLVTDSEPPDGGRDKPRRRSQQSARESSPQLEPLSGENSERLPPSYLVSAFYDGKEEAVCVKLYEPASGRIFLWHDTTGHKPYLLTNLSPFELDQLRPVKDHRGFSHFEIIEKRDLLQDKAVTLTKVVAKDPLAIGGRPGGCLREIIPEEYAKTEPERTEAKVWEAAIKYYQRYIYDCGLIPGMLYSVQENNLVQFNSEEAEKTVERIQTNFPEDNLAELEFTKRWARLLEYPAPSFKRVALDIEVFSPVATRVPDPKEAPYKVICASFVASDHHDRVLLLRRNDSSANQRKLPANTEVEFFDSEEELLKAVFRILSNYPFIITFNGDDFDLRYLARRAEKFGIQRSQTPIEVGRRVCLLREGVHIDLYKFFYNRSIQIYAFSNRYRDVNLNDVGKALIDLSKIRLEKAFAELDDFELARYCLRDAEITFKLTSFDNDLTMKLILLLARISKMTMEDVSRQGVSRWIRNFLQFEHSRSGILIPNAEDILSSKGKTTTTAIIKGKKYKGAIVVEPTPGAHFNVAVMDFASLYPSIIKVWNLGYQTIRCIHEDDKDNLVPGTSHWVCRKNKALESLLIGSLRDLRVTWYKLRAKDETLEAEARNWNDVVQRALKVILNASYGVFGSESFDLYCPPLAEATAAIARHDLTLIVKKAQELGIRVLYGDTDSVFLSNPPERQIRELASWSRSELKMSLDVDKVYRYAVFSSRKKNYLGVLEDGSVDVKGLTGKKRHIPQFIKEAFDDMMARLGKVESSVDFESAKKDMKKIVLDRYTRLKKRQWKHLDELAFHVVLGDAPENYRKTTPQHVMAARILGDRNVDVKAGDLVSFVKIKPREIIVKNRKELTSVMPVELATDSEVDIDKYVAYLQSTFEQVLDALELDFQEVIGLTRLERFM